MLIIKVDEKEGIERALKKLKIRFEKAKILKELKKRKEYTKPSVKRREEIKKAIYMYKKYSDK